MNMGENVLLTRALEGGSGRFDLNNKLATIFCFVSFNQLAQCTNLPLSPVETVGDIFSSVGIHN